MSNEKCKFCKNGINILYDKYYLITIEYDTDVTQSNVVYRFHKNCWENIKLCE